MRLQSQVPSVKQGAPYDMTIILFPTRAVRPIVERSKRAIVGVQAPDMDGGTAGDMGKTTTVARPAYRQALEAIGWYFDQQLYRGVFVAEVEDGYIGKARPAEEDAE